MRMARVGEPVVSPTADTTVKSVLQGFRPWHPLVQRQTHFEWATGLQVAVGFVVPAAIAAVTGWAPAAWSMISFGGFLATVVASSSRTTDQLLRSAPAIVAAVPVAIAVGMLTDGWGRVLLVALVGLAVGLASSGPLQARRAASSMGIAIVLAPELPSTAVAMGWTFVGGLWGVAVVLAALPLVARSAPSTAPQPAQVSRRAARHHGVRLAVALAVAAALAEVAGDATPIREHALWAGVGVWIVLQPHLHDTVTKGIQRAGGTLAGGVLTVLLVQLWPAAWWTGWLVLACTFACFGIRAANYGWYCVALTPVVVLGIGHLSTDLDVLQARIGWTVLGTVLALAVRFALWPVAAHREAAGPGRA